MIANTNRQVQIGRKAVHPPGEAKEDWWIEVQLAKEWGWTGPVLIHLKSLQK